LRFSVIVVRICD